MPNLRAAVIGAGFVGRAHIEALRRLAIPIAGVLGSSADTTRESSRSLEIDRAYASLDDLARDPQVDVVHICTPNYLHFDQAKALLMAGKHVLCEKPLAMDSRQSAELVALAKAHNRVAAVAYNLRYYPLCQEAHAFVQQGAIGVPRLVHGSFLQDWLFYDTDWNWRLDPQLGGDLRAVSDIGTHWLDLLSWITDKKIIEVCADLATVIPIRKRPRGRVETFQKTDAPTDEIEISTDDYASVLLRFEDTLRGVMTVSQVSAGRKARLWFEIDGSKASLAWNSEEPNSLWIGRRDQPNQDLIKDPALMTPSVRRFAAYPGGHAEGYPDTFVRLFQEVYGYIAAADWNARRTFPTFESGHEEMLLCDAIAQSARDRRWIKVA
jgi:predicted dehydrogenase